MLQLLMSIRKLYCMFFLNNWNHLIKIIRRFVHTNDHHLENEPRIPVFAPVCSSRRQIRAGRRRYSCVEDDQGGVVESACDYRTLNGKRLIEGRVEYSVGCQKDLIGISGEGEWYECPPLPGNSAKYTGERRVSRSFVNDHIRRMRRNISECTFRNQRVSLERINN